MDIKDIKRSKLTWRLNQYNFPTTQIDFSESSIEFFNSIVKKCNAEEYRKIKRTKSGGICYNETICPAYDVRATKSLIELTVCDEEGCFRLQVRTVNTYTDEDNNEKNLCGWKAFLTFRDICGKFNIDLKKYAIDNGAEVKKEIEKYKIELEPTTKLNYTYFGNVHHIDFHSSFPSGLAITHPEFTPVIEKLYRGRKSNPEYKYILNSTIGYMQSVSCCNAKWAHLSKDAINNNNERLIKLAETLKAAGRIVLSYNTDGIWYEGEIFHGEGEGDNIGEWSNDHTDCIIRFKSRGAYEFIEDDVYTPVIRGRTLLDDVKPREEWKWGDIYNKDTMIKKIILNKDNTLTIKFVED